MSGGRMTIPLSAHMGVSHEILEEHGVLDVLLGTDTKLFIDPKLLEHPTAPELAGSDKDIREYFSSLIAVHQRSEKVPRLQQIALGKIAIKEPQGLSIGYGNSRDSGTAIPITVARDSLKSLSEMLLVGVDDEKVMELLGLFVKDFGPDSISDLIAHIIYPRLCLYTQRIAAELKVPTQRFEINGQPYNLPAHPYKGHQLIFIPNDIVRDLPLATNWEEVIQAAQHNEKVRDAFNGIVGRAVRAFIKGIKKNPSLLTSSRDKMETLLQVYNEAEVEPYDIRKDPQAYDRLVKYAQELEAQVQASATKVESVDELITFVRTEVIEQYRRCIENNAGNTLLYHRKGKNAVDPTRPIKEDAAQTLFYLTADILCRVNNVFLSREPNAGQGAVDFSMGKGYLEKILVEIKKSNNNNLLDGFNKQLTSYIENEKAAHGFYVVVVVKENDNKNINSQLNQLKALYRQKISSKQPTPTLVVIDGLVHPSPSKR